MGPQILLFFRMTLITLTTLISYLTTLTTNELYDKHFMVYLFLKCFYRQCNKYELLNVFYKNSFFRHFFEKRGIFFPSVSFSSTTYCILPLAMIQGITGYWTDGDLTISLSDLREDARDARSALDPFSFIFMHFSAQILQNIRLSPYFSGYDTPCLGNPDAPLNMCIFKNGFPL